MYIIYSEIGLIKSPLHLYQHSIVSSLFRFLQSSRALLFWRMCLGQPQALCLRFLSCLTRLGRFSSCPWDLGISSIPVEIWSLLLHVVSVYWTVVWSQFWLGDSFVCCSLWVLWISTPFSSRFILGRWPRLVQPPWAVGTSSFLLRPTRPLWISWMH